MIILLLFFMKVGVIELSMCLFGFGVLVLQFIMLKVLGVFGFSVKLFILLFSSMLVFLGMSFELYSRLMVWVVLMWLLLWLMIEKCVVLLFFSGVGLFDSRLLGVVFFGWMVVCRFCVQFLLVSIFCGICMKFGLLRKNVWLWQVWCIDFIIRWVWCVGFIFLMFQFFRICSMLVSVMLLDDGGGVVVIFQLLQLNMIGLCCFM